MGAERDQKDTILASVLRPVMRPWTAKTGRRFLTQFSISSFCALLCGHGPQNKGAKSARQCPELSFRTTVSSAIERGFLPSDEFRDQRAVRGGGWWWDSFVGPLPFHRRVFLSIERWLGLGDWEISNLWFSWGEESDHKLLWTENTLFSLGIEASSSSLELERVDSWRREPLEAKQVKKETINLVYFYNPCFSSCICDGLC